MSKKTTNNSEQQVAEQKHEVVKNTVKQQAEKSNKTVANKKVKKQSKVKKGGIGRKLKETGSELKKVTWPAFPRVVRQTGVVIAVVVIFTLILFGIDRLLGFLFSLLTQS